MRFYNAKLFLYAVSRMVKRLHLEPEQKQEIVEQVVTELLPQLSKYVLGMIECYAITDKDVASRMMETLNRIEPRWYTRIFFRVRHKNDV